jgi:hypothetical protein
VGAVDAACRSVRERLFEQVGASWDVDPLRLVIDGVDVVDTMDFVSTNRRRRRDRGRGVRRDGGVPSIVRPSSWTPTVRGTATSRSRSLLTAPSSMWTSSSGSSRWCRSPTAQDVGVALNPLAVLGQIEGGIAQASASP